jgi:hypothetical protein
MHKIENVTFVIVIYYYKLQLSCHSVVVQTKQVRKHIHKRNNTKNTLQTIQNTVNTSTRITKTNTHYKTHTYSSQQFAGWCISRSIIHAVGHIP